MNLLITVLAFIFAIGVLVTFHELGHYSVARFFDVKILRFSIGFGRPLLLWRHGQDQTEWVIAMIPLGGFVKMADESEAAVAKNELHRAFNQKPVWQRALVVLAGPVANLILAATFYWVLLVSGVPGMKPVIAAPPAQTIAALAGFSNGDLISSIDNEPMQSWSDVRWVLLKKAVNHAVVDIAVESESKVLAHHTLDLSSVNKDDLESDFLSKLGLMPYRLKMKAEIGLVVAGGVADIAGMKVGDVVLLAANQSVASWDELVTIIRARPAQAIEVLIRRGVEEISLRLVADSATENGQQIGRIGIGVAQTNMSDESKRFFTVIKLAPLPAIGRAWVKVWDTSLFSLKMMGRMIVGEVSWKNLSGPVTIADYAGQTAMLGWIAYINFLALVSISLGVLNLLPIPVLDGGQLMYYMAEFFKGSPLSVRTMEFGQRIGLTLLLCLTAFAFYNDIQRLITG